MHYFQAMTTFKELGIGNWLIKQLDELNLRKPTPVQAFFQIKGSAFIRLILGRMYSENNGGMRRFGLRKDRNG